MTWTATRTWTTGELVTAAYANSYWRDDLDHLAAFGVGGSAFSALTPATNLSKIATGSYTGNGADDRNITGVGFTPKAIFVWRDDNSYPLLWRTTSYAGDKTAFQDSTYVNNTVNAIQALSSDGFQVGSYNGTNQNAITFYYMAWG